ncbi:F-box domain-containing protein [Favolaschia claudopus]|uniref:F-box domain-containing protein n=1 Tax=Favolaschia claudopus TaxID=2862362 RepID=A0AAV9Z993_9AGAR
MSTSNIRLNELRTRIVKLNSEIGVQLEVLKKLESDRSLVLREMNAVLDPFARLPLEISSEIFVHCLDNTASNPGALQVPLLLLNICHSWTNIALSTTNLWTTIDVTFPCSRGLKKLLPMWFQRARNRKLSVCLSNGKFSGDLDVLDVVWNHGRQLKCLELRQAPDDDRHSPEPIDIWGGRTPLPLSSLTTLVIGGMVKNQLVSLPIIRLLRLAPNLLECFIDAIRVPLFSNDPDLMHLTLRRLVVGKLGKRPRGDDEYLGLLSLPFLEALSLPMIEVDDHTLIEFFKRSSPPLRELVLGNAPAFDALEECLHLAPDLQTFEIWWQIGSAEAELFFKALIDSPTLLLNLKTLIIHLYNAPAGESVSESFWTTFCAGVRVRAARQSTCIRIFRKRNLNASSTPPLDALAAFKELAQLAGVRIGEVVTDTIDGHV